MPANYSPMWKCGLGASVFLIALSVSVTPHSDAADETRGTEATWLLRSHLVHLQWKDFTAVAIKKNWGGGVSQGLRAGAAS